MRSLTLLLFLAFARCASAVILPVTEDTSADAKLHLTSGSGKASTLLITDKRAAYFRFDASALAGTRISDIVRARLIVYVVKATKQGAITIGETNNSEWGEVLSSATPQPGITGFDTLPGPFTGKQFVVFDVTDRITSYTQIPANYEFGLIGGTGALISIASKEGLGHAAILEVETGLAGVASVDGGLITAGSVGSDQLASGLTLGGTTSGTFSGDGSLLTNLSAGSVTGQLTSGQLASNLTLGGTTAGTFSGDGSALTQLNSNNLTGDLSVGQAGGMVSLDRVQETQIGNGTAFGVSISGSYAFLSNGTAGLKVLNLASKTHAIPVGTGVPESAMGNDYAYQLAISGNFGIVANGTAGICLVDLSNPEAPVAGAIVSETALGSDTAYDVAISGNYAFVANGNAGLRVVDISDKNHPQVVGSVPESALGNGLAYGIAIKDNIAVLANYGGGMRIIDVTNKANPQVISSLPLSAPFGVTLSGNYAFLTYTDLKIVDVSDPAHPILSATVNFGPGISAYNAAISGNFAYVSTDNGLQVVDITSKSNPVILDTPLSKGVLGNGDPRHIAISGNYAVLANGLAGANLIAIATTNATAFQGDGSLLTNLSAAHISGQIASAQLASGLTLSGTTSGTFSGNGSALTTLNASNFSSGTVADARLSSNVALLNANNTFLNKQTISASGSVGAQHLLNLASSGTGGTWLDFDNNDTGGRQWSLISTGTANGEGAGKLLIRDGSAGVRLTIDSGGQVGIGTTSPGSTLDVNGALRVSGGSQFPFNVETSSPGGTWFLLHNDATGGREWDLISTGSGNGEGSGKLLIRDASAGVRLTVDTNGQLGVGTVFPNSTLQVNGSLSLPVRVMNGALPQPNVLGDGDYVLIVPPSTGLTNIYLPQTAIAGRLYVIKNKSGVNLTLTFASPGPQIEGGSSLVIANNTVAQVICDGTNWQKIN